MDAFKNALPPEGGAKPAQNPTKIMEPIPRGRLFLALTAVFCVLLVDTLVFHGPAAGLTAAVFFHKKRRKALIYKGFRHFALYNLRFYFSRQTVFTAEFSHILS